MPRHGRFVTLRLAAAVAVTASLTAALAASGPAFPTAYAATVAPTRLCAGDDWGGPANANPWRHLDAGYVSVYGKPAVRVILAGRVDWGANPYSNAKWQAWFMSLKWLGDYYNKSAGRMGIDMHTPTHAERIAFLESALSITAQYAAFSSGARTAAQIAAQQATDGHRALAIVCLAEQDEILNGSVRPWLTSLIGTELATLISRGHEGGEQVEAFAQVGGGSQHAALVLELHAGPQSQVVVRVSEGLLHGGALGVDIRQRHFVEQPRGGVGPILITEQAAGGQHRQHVFHGLIPREPSLAW